MRILVLADLRAGWRNLAALGGGAFVFLVVLCGTYSAFGGAKGFGTSLGGGNTPKIFSAFSGSSSGDIFTPAHYLAFGFGHPMFILLMLSVAISRGVAAVATDVETGRAEMLYTAPVRRTAILNTRILGWAVAQAVVLAAAVAGALLGSRLSAPMSGVSLLVPLRVGLQFIPLVFFFAAVAFAASARARSHGVALGVAVGVAAGSYLANLVALLWSPLGFVRHLDPFGYYDATAAAAHVAWGDVTVLMLGGGLLVLLAQRWLERRDLA